MDLQIFADAGSVVNATGGYVNAANGSVESFGANTLAPELKSFYDTELLENTRSELIYAQFAKRQSLPANHHGSVEWRKWNTFEPAGRLSEGVIPTGQKFGVTTVTGSVDQYGTYTAVSDKLELRAYDDVILGATEEMGASAAETQEKLIRDALATGTNVMYCETVTRSDGKPVAGAAVPTTQGEMVFSSTQMSMLTPAMINKAVTVMKKNRVPRINGRYYAVVHPSVAHDLRECPDWIEAHRYAAPEELYNGEIGELHGVRFIEDASAPVFRGDDLSASSRTLKVNHSGGYSGSITSIAFTGTVAENALKGRRILIGSVSALVTGNSTSAITVEATDFGTVADETVIYPGEGGPAGVAVYATYFFGKDSFGIIDPEGGALEMIIHDKGEIGGPLNQFSTIGYKFETNGATILYPERLLRVMSCSSYSDADEAN